MRFLILIPLLSVACANPNAIDGAKGLQLDVYAGPADPTCQGPTMQFDVYSADQGHPNAVVSSKLYCADVNATDVAPTCKYESSQNARDSQTTCGVIHLLCVVPGKKPFEMTVPNTCVQAIEVPRETVGASN